MPEMSLRFSASKMPVSRSTVVVVKNHSWSALGRHRLAEAPDGFERPLRAIGEPRSGRFSSPS